MFKNAENERQIISKFYFRNENKINIISDSASMIPANITFKNVGKSFSNDKYRKKCCVKLMMVWSCLNSFRKFIDY